MLRALLAFLVILSMGVPLWHLTRAQPDAAARSEEPLAPVARSVQLQVSFTQIPQSLRISHLGKEVLAVPTPEAESDFALDLAFPAEGVELVFNVAWAGDELAAMRVRLTDPAGREFERSAWGRGTAKKLTN